MANCNRPTPYTIAKKKNPQKPMKVSSEHSLPCPSVARVFVLVLFLLCFCFVLFPFCCSCRFCYCTALTAIWQTENKQQHKTARIIYFLRVGAMNKRVCKRDGEPEGAREREREKEKERANCIVCLLRQVVFKLLEVLWTVWSCINLLNTLPSKPYPFFLSI